MKKILTVIFVLFMICMCGCTQKAEIPRHDHEYEELIINEATWKQKGTFREKCKICGECGELEEYSISEEEFLEFVEENCTEVTYDDLARYPSKYEGQPVILAVRVCQIFDGDDGEQQIRGYMSVNDYGIGDDDIYIFYEPVDSDMRVLEDDVIILVGEGNGTLTYTTVMDTERTVPCVNAYYAELYEE